MRKATITIVLEYDLDNHFDDEDYSDYTPDQIAEALEDTVYEDLSDLMRGDKLKTWSEISITDKDTK